MESERIEATLVIGGEDGAEQQIYKDVEAYDPATDPLARCAPRSVAAGDRPLILVHGLHGAERTFRAWLPLLAAPQDLAAPRLPLLRPPNNESPSRRCRFWA